MVLVMQAEMVRILIAAAILGGLVHGVGVLVGRDLWMGLGRMMRPGHRRHRQQNEQNRYDRAHRKFLRETTMHPSSAERRAHLERNIERQYV